MELMNFLSDKIIFLESIPFNLMSGVDFMHWYGIDTILKLFCINLNIVVNITIFCLNIKYI